ncbi:spermatogenesis-associated protein 20 [Orussus abietinus]|uniref:spermatogenesis-associated protein 20 n=1 Tax=Orussus abietinus TaxID=222816 RepID=UPI000625D47F|nr:spermatogenesis-associated protein 20 [Orussus abietinus]
MNLVISGRRPLANTLRCFAELSKHSLNNRRKGFLAAPESTAPSIVKSQFVRSDSSSTAVVSLELRMASTSSDGDPHASPGKQQNRLALEKSPYLLQHATNPVQWYPWGREALEKARSENKLIFLSIGYSTCHWCHVMEKESFEDPEIAKVMNSYFVNIKVDREERPDIDNIYMSFIVALSGHGGWPMSVFLTPDLSPVFGGTYFPPTDKHGQAGFKTVLLAIATQWNENRDNILKTGKKMIEVLKSTVVVSSRTASESIPSIDSAETCARQLARRYDHAYGGFTDPPKFPQPVNLNLLFLMYARNPSGQAAQQYLKMCTNTLIKMARGGIHDHVGQGFARYTLDGRWHIPHFEKMLYDQGQLLRSYAEAYVATKDEFFAEIVDDIVTYVTRDLRHKEGGFYSAEDADSLPSQSSKAKREGAFYVWTYLEVESLLDKRIPSSENLSLSDIFCFHFMVRPEGNVRSSEDPHKELCGQNVLMIEGSLEKTAEHFKMSTEDTKRYIEEGLKILFEERSKRPRPHLDSKIVTAWNGLMISGLSIAGASTGNKKYVEYAEMAARFIEKYLFDRENRVLLRSCYRDEGDRITQTSTPIEGFHVDYAFIVRGLLDLYEASLDTHWLKLAEELQNIQDELFWDQESAAYFSTTGGDPSVIFRMKDDHDGAEPSSNSVACGNLLKLHSYFNRAEFSDKAARLLLHFGETLAKMPTSVPEMVCALITHHEAVAQIFVAGKKDAEDTEALLRVVRGRLLPGRTLLLVDEASIELLSRNEVLTNMAPLNGRATAYVCRHRTCSLPVTEPARLSALLDAKNN